MTVTLAVISLSLKADKSYTSQSQAIPNSIRDLFSLERVYAFKKYKYLARIMLLRSTVRTTKAKFKTGIKIFYKRCIALIDAQCFSFITVNDSSSL